MTRGLSIDGPVRVQLSRVKGWRIPENTVKVSRPGKWGNPFDFRHGDYCWLALSYDCRGDRLGRQEASVKAFREWIAPGDGKRTIEVERGVVTECGGKKINMGRRVHVTRPAPPLDELRAELAGKNLACWCKLGEPCHADVLLELANADPAP